MSVWKVVSWSPGEVITSEKMTDMVNRDTYLNENKVSGHYRAHGVTRNTGIIMVSGIASFAALNADRRRVQVHLGNTFSAACRPIVTNGLVSPSASQIFVNTSGIGSQRFPTRDGFELVCITSVAYAAKNRKLSNMWVMWTAVGY